MGKQAKKITTKTEKQTNFKENIHKYLFNEKVLIILLLSIAIFAGVFFRMYPASLPVTHEWAENSYHSQIKNTINQQVLAQYPNLPVEQRNQFVEERFAKELKTNGDQLEPQIQQTADYFKSKLQNENNQTYLLAIDPYLWYSYAKNYIKNGHPGTTITGGEYNMELRNGKEPRFEKYIGHSAFMVQFYKIIHFFNNKITLQRAIFFYPVIIISLAIICAFFLGRRIAGNIGGFVAGLALALNGALLGRTPAGFSDTDAYIIFFPLLVAWLFLEGLTITTKWKKYSLMSLSGAALSIFILLWNTGWHIGTLIIGTAGIYSIYLLITTLKQLKKKHFKLFETKLGQLIFSTSIFIISSALFSQLIGLLTRLTNMSAKQTLKYLFLGPLGALSIKNVATTNIWPNVLTTVAELNAGSWGQVVGSIGGTLFFILGIAGAILTILPTKKKENLRIQYSALLVLWFAGISLAGIMSARFIALLAAPFAIALGAFFGMSWILIKKITTKDLRLGAQISLLIIIGLLFITPIQAAQSIGKQEIPSMNDAWHDSLTAIGADTEDGIITSWWDFGHWFVNVAEERVTFDGGDQGKRIYWVGKLLMTDSSAENKAILRMLNCGQNVGYERILEATKDNYLSSNLIQTIVQQSTIDAKQTLLDAGLTTEETTAVLEKTHCSNEELLDQYVIASDDMIGKANVWAHFGSWNFTKAQIYSVIRKQGYDQALTSMAELGITDEETAAQLYFEANNLKDSRAVDSWISPWPGYITQSTSTCVNNTNNITCSMGLQLQQQQNVRVTLDGLFVDTANVTASYLVIGTYQGTNRVNQEQMKPAKITTWENNKWVTTIIENATFPYEFIVGPDGTGTYKVIAGDDAVADSAFTKMFFFDGTGLEGYTKFSDKTSFNGQRILVYKVDLTV